MRLNRTQVFVSFISLLALAIFMTAMPATAQTGYGEITGDVMDSSHAAVVGAKVELSNQATGESRTAITNSAGAYRFTAVNIVGSYSITITATGFRTYKATGLVVSVGAVLTRDVTLTVGASQMTVMVNASSEPEIQTTTSSVSQLIDQNVWKNAPLETRTSNDFVYLTAGAAQDNGTGRGAAVDGARTGSGNFVLDGYDNNDQALGGGSALFGGGSLVTISPDALEEYRVMAHDNSAVYGKSGGFSTDTVLKSGTNQWHGTLFEYNRIQALASEHFFNGFAGNHLHDSLVRNQFGGSVGGPIWKNKTFFYATVELHRLRTGGPLTTTATTSDFVSFVNSGAFETFNETDPGGLCVQFNGKTCPGAFAGTKALGPVFQQLYSAEKHNFPYATSNFYNQGQGLYSNVNNLGVQINYPVNVYGLVSVTQPQATNQYRGSFRFDQTFSDKDSFSSTYAIDRSDSSIEYGGGGTAIGPDYLNPTDAQIFGMTWTHIFNPTLTNQVKASYLRHYSNFYAPGTTGVPQIVTAIDPLGVGFGAYAGFPQPFTENQFQYQEGLTKVAGRHTLYMGGEFRRIRNGSSFYNDVYGSFYPYDVENLLTDGVYGDEADMAVFGAPTFGGFYESSASIDMTTNKAPDPYRGYRANEVAMYIQDDWRVISRLTINIGLRWEYFGPPHNFKPNIDSNVYWGAAYTPITPAESAAAGYGGVAGNPSLPINNMSVAQIATATFQIKNHDIWNKDLHDFGPRFGFAYDLTGASKYVVRGGYSIGYDRIYNNVFENIRFNPPHFADNAIGALVNGVVAGPAEQQGIYAAPFTGNSALATYGGKPVPRHMDQDMVTPYYEGYHLGIETALGRGFMLETDYVGTHGRKLVGLRDVNNYPGRTSCPPGTYSPTSVCGAAGYPNGFSANRPTSVFASDNFRSNYAMSNYNGLQLSLRKQFSGGFDFTANYTYSKTLDETSDVFTANNGLLGITNPMDPLYDYGPADFDHRQMFVANGTWQSKWKPRNLILGGWQTSGILKRYSGSPIGIYDSAAGANSIHDGRLVDRPVLASGYTMGQVAPGLKVNYSPVTGAVAYLNPNALTPMNCGSALWCESPLRRNSFYGPAYIDLDLGIMKVFRVTEHSHFRYEANFFNIFNHPNFGNPTPNLNSGTFGQITSTGDPRVTQMALRFEF